MILAIDRNREPYFEGVKVLHDYWTLSITCRGTGTRTAGRKHMPLQPGTIVCVPPNVVHQSVSADGMVDIVLYVTVFDPGQKAGGQAFFVQDDANGTARALMELMHRIFLNRNTFEEGFLEALYTNLCMFLDKRIALANSDLRVLHITDYLNARYTDAHLAIDALLRQEKVSPDYLRRLFKLTHGCTPVQYLNRLRVKQARNQLEANRLTHYSIAEIAAHVGFEDVSYFSRVFRQYTGYSPTQSAETFRIVDME